MIIERLEALYLLYLHFIRFNAQGEEEEGGDERGNADSWLRARAHFTGIGLLSRAYAIGEMTSWHFNSNYSRIRPGPVLANLQRIVFGIDEEEDEYMEEDEESSDEEGSDEDEDEYESDEDIALSNALYEVALAEEEEEGEGQAKLKTADKLQNGLLILREEGRKGGATWWPLGGYRVGGL